MFDFVRSNNRVIQVVMGVVLVVFALAGGGGAYNLFKEHTEAVATVNGKDISRADWDARQRQNVDNMRRRNPQADTKLLDSPAAKRASLESLIREEVLRVAEARQDLTASPDRAVTYFKNDPQYAQIRAMGVDQFKLLLQAQGSTPDAFVEQLRQQLGQNQALAGVTQSGLVPAVASKAGMDALFGQREIQWQHLDTKDYAAQSQPTDAQLKAYYEDKAHAAEFKTPEEAKIEYVVFGIDALKAQMNPNPDEVRKYYDNNRKQFGVVEERRASHIQVSVAQDASAADVAKAKAKAEAILAEVRKNPASFADVAKKESDDVGTKAQGGDLDFLSEKTAPTPDFGKALFALKEGQISDLVRTPQGFHIIEMTALRGGTVRPFDEARPQIEDTLRTQLAQKAFASGADKFTNLVFEEPSKLPAKVEDGNAAYTLATQTATVQRRPAQGATGALASPRLLDAIFASDSVQKKHNTEAIDTGSSQLVSARIVEYHPERTRPLAEVHDQVADAVRKQLTAAAAKKDGEARVEAARKDAKLALPIAATVSRMTSTPPDTPRPVVEAALKADITKGPAVAGIALPDGGYAVVRVVKELPRKADDALNPQAKAQIDQAYDEAEAQAVYESLKTRYKTKVDEAQVAHAATAAASAN